MNKTKEKVGSRLVKLLIAFVLLLAAVTIYVLFENLKSINVYFIYVFLGIIIGMSGIILLNLFVKSNS